MFAEFFAPLSLAVAVAIGHCIAFSVQRRRKIKDTKTSEPKPKPFEVYIQNAFILRLRSVFYASYSVRS